MFCAIRAVLRKGYSTDVVLAWIVSYVKQSDGKGVSKERRNLESKDAMFVLHDVHRRRSFRLENTSAIDYISTSANPNDILNEDRVIICLRDK